MALVTTTAASAKPTLPLHRRYDDSKGVNRALTDIISALNSGGFTYQGQRQPIYPFKRLVTTMLSLPSAVDAGFGAEAFITDSQVPYSAAFIGTLAQGGGAYFTRVYSGVDVNGNTNWLVG